MFDSAYDPEDYTTTKVSNQKPPAPARTTPVVENNCAATNPNESIVIETKSATTIKLKTEKCDSNSNIMLVDGAKSITAGPPPPDVEPQISLSNDSSYLKSKFKNLSSCTVVLNSIDTYRKTTTTSKPQNTTRLSIESAPPVVAAPLVENNGASSDATAFSDDESDGEIFEIEESETPHVPLYTLRDEGAVKWALLSDLCYLLKVKSKETLLKQVHC